MAAVFYHHCCLTDMWTSKTGARRSPHDLTFVSHWDRPGPDFRFGSLADILLADDHKCEVNTLQDTPAALHDADWLNAVLK